jgi:hypothetical protein
MMRYSCKGMHVAEHKEAGTNWIMNQLGRKYIVEERNYLREMFQWKAYNYTFEYYIWHWIYKAWDWPWKGKNLYDKSKAIKLRDLDRDLKEMYNIKTPSFKLNHNYPNEKNFNNGWFIHQKREESFTQYLKMSLR